jgi:hypothetical protein
VRRWLNNYQELIPLHGQQEGRSRRHGLAGANPLGALSKEMEALARALVGDDLIAAPPTI